MTNYTLIGMAAAGKSTFGKKIADKLGYTFLDIDELISKGEKKSITEVIKEVGEKGFLNLEEKYIMNLNNISKTVVSPGGSIIYSEKSMKKLKKISKIIFINTDKETIRKRIEERAKKGEDSIIGLKEKGFDKLYEERLVLYKKYSDIEIRSAEELEQVFL